ncbi:MAG TPA: glycosyl hydrolase family 65 protein [Acidimicrobiales bacterium]|jgi:alpha,alpha-trehalose phosphorylase|nr:glycosyl hydrolase family 65 protein [Acidimicrobiales bacterium]
MIEQPAFTVEPWGVREIGIDLDRIAQMESVFALSNGHIGWRGNLDEGEPHGLPGSYLSGVYEVRPLPYAEAGYGYPESGQTVVNVTNGKIIRLLVDDEPFDVRYGQVASHDVELDFRAGVVRRTVDWISPAGQQVRISSTRMVSFVQRAIAAVRYEVEAVGAPARVVVQSELVANEQLPAAGGDPRVAAAITTPWQAEAHSSNGTRVNLVHATKRSGLRMAAAMDHVIEGPGPKITSEASDDLGRVAVTAELAAGERLTVVKFVAYGWSAERSVPAVRDQVDAALTLAVHTGWDRLAADQRSYLDDFWSHGDVDLEGDTEIQQAVRFALFHVLQAGARAEGRAIAAKGLTGPGYDGHAFWDSETYVLPMLTYTSPSAAKFALAWRHSTLPAARERARQLGLRGAAFPWRTIGGEECSGYWPAGTAAFHIGADIADAVVRYVCTTGDREFEATVGLELLVETARLWRSLGHHDAHGAFRIDGVTGPDEYSAVADNNVFTNLMARQNLQAAAAAAERHVDPARRLGVDDEEMASWRDAADKMTVPYDADLGVHPQAEGFTAHETWDFEHTPAAKYPLLLHFPYFDLYRKQVVKQADLVLAMQLFPDEFTAEEKARNFGYYERITVRDSSLSACCQAVIAAEVGHLDLAYDYLGEAALMDLDDLEHNTRDGLHIASLAGVWMVLVAGFGGLRRRGDHLCFAPRLPEALSSLRFALTVGKACLHVRLTPQEAEYSMEGESITVWHEGEQIEVPADGSVRRPMASLPALPRPTQPHGRAPRQRRPPRN